MKHHPPFAGNGFSDSAQNPGLKINLNYIFFFQTVQNYLSSNKSNKLVNSWRLFTRYKVVLPFIFGFPVFDLVTDVSRDDL